MDCLLAACKVRSLELYSSLDAVLSTFCGPL